MGLADNWLAAHASNMTCEKTLSCVAALKNCGIFIFDRCAVTSAKRTQLHF